ncbi:hypothetical protein AB0D56_38715, partial [Streptomyces sp. NPDC048209]|uniref:hypothetical protein n=1 Tax=Streptomyces sp. NPDC048209 TaxID=3156689 RepID=UPI00344472B9
CTGGAAPGPLTPAPGARRSRWPSPTPDTSRGPHQVFADVSADCWRGRWCKEGRNDNDDGWREHHDVVPIVATTLDLLAECGPLGPV